MLLTDIELVSIDAVDHVESPLSRATVDECDLYYYEEESMSLDVVCELTQMSKMTQRDLIISEERSTSPVQDESVFIQPLWTRGNKYKCVQHHYHYGLKKKFNFTNRVIPISDFLNFLFLSA